MREVETKKDLKEIENLFQQKSSLEKWAQSKISRRLTCLIIILYLCYEGLFMSF